MSKFPMQVGFTDLVVPKRLGDVGVKMGAFACAQINESLVQMAAVCVPDFTPYRGGYDDVHPTAEEWAAKIHEVFCLGHLVVPISTKMHAKFRAEIDHLSIERTEVWAIIKWEINELHDRIHDVLRQEFAARILSKKRI